MKRRIIAWGLAVLVIIPLYACSSGSTAKNNSIAYDAAPQAASAPMANSMTSLSGGTTGSYDSGYGYTEESVAYEAGETYDTAKTTQAAEKIIQTAQIALQSDRFDAVVADLRRAAPDCGGYVESADLYGVTQRVFSITLRVPADQFEDTRRRVEAMGLVTSASQNAEDVTAQYYDTASRLETKKIEEERVVDMITRAVKIEDLLALEQRLGEIRTQIERYEAQLTNIDRLAAFSTIHVSLTEVTKEALIIVSDNLGGRIQKAFIRSVNGTVSFFQEVVIFLAGALIPLAVVGLLLLVGIKAAFAAHHKQKQKRSDSNEKM